MEAHQGLRPPNEVIIIMILVINIMILVYKYYDFGSVINIMIEAL